MRLLTFLLLSILVTITQANETQQKIEFIQQNFQANHDHSKSWQWGWFGFLASSTVLQTIGTNTLEDEKITYDMGVGAATSFLGAADMLINPMQSHYYSTQLLSMNEGNSSAQQAKLMQAEAWLNEAVRREKYEQSLTNHLLSGLVNGLGALLIAYDDNRPRDALLSFAAGMAVSEIKIYTAPQSMTTAKSEYQKGNYSLKTSKSEEQRLFITATGSHLFINWRF